MGMSRASLRFDYTGSQMLDYFIHGFRSQPARTLLGFEQIETGNLVKHQCSRALITPSGLVHLLCDDRLYIGNFPLTTVLNHDDRFEECLLEESKSFPILSAVDAGQEFTLVGSR